MHIQLVINILGFLLIFLAGSMLLPIPFSIYYGDGDFLSFIYSAVITFIVGFLSYIRDRSLLPGTNETSTELSDYTKSSIVIFHPTVLGAIVVLLIAVFTIALLSGKAK